MEKQLKSDKEVYEYTPPQNMRTFVEVLLSEDVKWNQSKAESICGVKRQIFYYYYKKYPEFRRWVSDQCDLLLGKYEGIAGFSLIGAMLKNDVTAIRTYYELRGKLKQKETNVRVGVSVNNKVGANGSFVGEDRELTDRLMGVLRSKLQK